MKFLVTLLKKCFSPIEDMLKRRERCRLRKIMRGYRVMKRTGCLDKIAVVKQALTECSPGLANRRFSSAMMGEGVTSGEFITRQYLLARLGGLNLNRALLLSMGTENGLVRFPLPREWREVLMEHGFRVAHFRSALLWQFYVCALFLYGMLKIGRIAYSGIVSGKEASAKLGSYAYFADLVPGNLPRISEGFQSHDVISWYLQWPDRSSKVDSVRHGIVGSSPLAVGKIAVLPQDGPLPAFSEYKEVFRFLLWGVLAAAISAIDCLRGRWWHGLLLNQAALNAQARILSTASLAREYLFHNSSWIYRPLWTYEAERRGSTITFYFYSTNCETFKQPDGYPPMAFGWKAMNWPRYLVWDDYQIDFVRRAVGKAAEVAVVGPIWFQDSAEALPTVRKKTIAMFDITPFRSSAYQSMALSFEYYVPRTSLSFLSDVRKCAEDLGYTLMYKRKRKIGRSAHPKYRYLSNALLTCENVIMIDADISAYRVVEESAIVISMPFTSTALVARELGKPSCYYDPCFALQEDDRAAHGIPIIQGADRLREWIGSQFIRQGL